MFQPLHKRFTAKEIPDQASSIIFLNQPKPKTAEVLTISEMEPMSVQPGDIVHIGKHVKETVPNGEEEVLLVDDGDVQLVNGKAHADRILIELEVVSDKIGSVFIPETSKDRPSRGKIIDHGPKTELRSGQWVHFQKTDGMPIEINNKKLWILKNCDILGVEE